jgi:hypothetical protein
MADMRCQNRIPCAGNLVQCEFDTYDEAELIEHREHVGVVEGFHDGLTYHIHWTVSHGRA